MNVRGNTILLAITALALIRPGALSGADMLKWDAAHDRVEAQIETWTVPQVLERIAAVTGWQIQVDPTINERFRTQFSDKETGDALRRLLGSLNYAFVPETNQASKLYVFRRSRDEATRTIGPVKVTKGERGLIANELVVTLKPGEDIDELAKQLGAKVVGRAEAQNTYRLRFEDAAAAEAARAALENNDAVAAIDNNYSADRPIRPQALGPSDAPLGLRPKAVPDGEHIIVGLIDSVVQADDADFAGLVLPALSVAGEGTDTSGGPSHGTSMAETLLRGLSLGSESQSTAVRVLPVDVYGDSGMTSTFDVALGIYKAVNAGAMIINLSLGTEADSAFLRNTIRSAHEQGVVFLAAAGNEPVPTPTFPAAYPQVIAVTAGDRRGNIAPYANYGAFVDAIAPGTSIVTYQGQQYYVVGTSAATAFASGLAAAAAERAKIKGGPSLESAVRSILAPRSTGSR